MCSYDGIHLQDREAALAAFAFHFGVLWDQECRVYNVADPSDLIRGILRLSCSRIETCEAAEVYLKHLSDEEQRRLVREVANGELALEQPPYLLSE